VQETEDAEWYALKRVELETKESFSSQAYTKLNQLTQEQNCEECNILYLANEFLEVKNL
jgi:hypothetical protein